MKFKKYSLVFLVNFLVLISIGQRSKDYPTEEIKVFGFSGSRLNYASNVMKARDNSNVIAAKNHVYFVGEDNKIYGHFWNGNTWTGGHGQLDWTSNPYKQVRSSSLLQNSGNDLFYISTNDKIYGLTWSSDNGWTSYLLSSDAEPAREGTHLVYNNNRIYYVGQNSEKVCAIKLQEGNWIPECPLTDWYDATVRENSQIIAKDDWVFFINTHDDVCSFHHNGTNWTGGRQLEWDERTKVSSNHNLSNDGNKIYYVGKDKYIYELRWYSSKGWDSHIISDENGIKVKDNIDIQYFDNHIYFVCSNDDYIYDLYRTRNELHWIGVKAPTYWHEPGDPTQQKVKENTQLKVYSNNLPYEGQQSGAHHSHHVFYQGKNNHKINFLINDLEAKDHDSISYKWHYGCLNSNNQIFSNSNIAENNDHFYYISSNHYINDFLRGAKNPIIKNGWGEPIFHDEFDTFDIVNGCNWSLKKANNNDDSITMHFDSSQIIHENGLIKFKIQKNGPLDYTTGGIDQRKIAQKCGKIGPWKRGYFEIRCKFPRGNLLWPTFWIWGKQGEIDIFEGYGNGRKLISNMYDYIDNNRSDTLIRMKTLKAYASGYRYYQGFNTYAVEWYKSNETDNTIEHAKFYINNNLIGAIDTAIAVENLASMGITASMGVKKLPQNSNEIINFDSAQYAIDYIRVYNKNSEYLAHSAKVQDGKYKEYPLYWPENSEIEISTCNQYNKNNTKIELFDKYYNLLAENDDSQSCSFGETFSTINYNLCAGSEYKIRVRNEGDNTGYHSLTVRKLDDTVCDKRLIRKDGYLPDNEKSQRSESKGFIKLSPNPADDIIHIESNRKINKIEVYDNLGRLVLSRKNDKDYINVSLINIAKGTYILKIISKDKQKTKRVQVK